MHDSALAWVATCVGIGRLAERSTLEIGSQDPERRVRRLFRGPYLGIDMAQAPGVDQVMNAHALRLADGSFDVVICTEVLEHDDAFWLTLAEIRRVLRPGGSLILTTRGNGYPEHRFPHDLWRFMPESGQLLASLAGCAATAVVADPEVPGLFLYGTREA